MLILDGSQMISLLSLHQVIGAVEQSMIAYEHGEATAPQRMHLDHEKNTLLCMPSWGSQYLGTKLVTVMPGSSILAATRTPVPPAARLEGIDLIPIAAGKTPVTERTLFWRVRTGGLNQRAVRSGDMKLLIDGTARVMLFNVRQDVSEHADLAQQSTAVVRRLYQRLQAWETDVDAEAKAVASPRQPMR